MAQLVQHLPRTQKIAGSSPARGSSSFSLEKEELSSGVVACICLVSITDYSCIYMHIKTRSKTHYHTSQQSPMINVHTSVCPVSPGSHLVWSVPHTSADTISILICQVTISQNSLSSPQKTVKMERDKCLLQVARKGREGEHTWYRVLTAACITPGDSLKELSIPTTSSVGEMGL